MPQISAELTADQKNLVVYAIEELRVDKGWSFVRLLDEIFRCAEYSLDKNPKEFGVHHRYKWRNHVTIDQLRKIASGARPIKFPYDIVIRDYLFHTGRLSEGTFSECGIAIPRGRVTVHELRELWRQSNFNLEAPSLLVRCRIRLSEGILSRLWMARTPNGNVEFELIQESVTRSPNEARSVFRRRCEGSKRSMKSITIGNANLDGENRLVLVGVERRAGSTIPAVWVGNKLSDGGIQIEKIRRNLPKTVLYSLDSQRKLTSSEKRYIINLSRDGFLRRQNLDNLNNRYLKSDYDILFGGVLRFNKRLISSAHIDDTIGMFTAIFDGADINFQDENGDTVRHICARRRNLSALRIFYGTFSESDAEAAIVAVSKVTESDAESVQERASEAISGIDFKIRNLEKLLPSEVFPVPARIKDCFDCSSCPDVEETLVCYSSMVTREDNALAEAGIPMEARSISLEDYNPK